MRKSFWSLVIVTGLLLSLAGCGGAPAKKAEEKILRVGTEATFPPFEFQDEKSKEYTGFDMDLIRAVGKQMGYNVKIDNLGFDGLIPALEAGNIDVIASGMTITEERAKKVAFTKPYYDSGLTIVVGKDNNQIKDFPDLEGKRLAVQIGTTGAQEAARVKGAKVREFNSVGDTFLELKNGGVDAVVNDRPVNAYFLTTGGGIAYAKEVGKPRNAESYGFAVSKKNEKMAAEMDKALEALKKSGEYEKIYSKWFGKTVK